MLFATAAWDNPQGIHCLGASPAHLGMRLAVPSCFPVSRTSTLTEHDIQQVRTVVHPLAETIVGVMLPRFRGPTGKEGVVMPVMPAAFLREAISSQLGSISFARLPSQRHG